jgi:hypothetical protein
MAHINNNFGTPKLHGLTTPHVKSPIVSKKEETETTALPTDSTAEFTSQASTHAEHRSHPKELAPETESVPIASPSAGRTHHSNAPLRLHDVQGINLHGEDQMHTAKIELNGLHSTKLVGLSGAVRANLNPLGL